MARDWIKEKHPLYAEREREWRQSERRYHGGLRVLPELVPFDWEKANQTQALVDPGQGELAAYDLTHGALPMTTGLRGDHYGMRQMQAVYVNYPELLATSLVGQLFRKAPAPGAGLDFGTLGEVSRQRAKVATRAELIYFNVDGQGQDGSQWDAWWGEVDRWSVVTGHRWVFCEAPLVAPSTMQQEIDGQRPYLVQYSPLSITNWEFTDGKLAWCVVRFTRRTVRVVGDKFEGNAYAPGYRVMVKTGVSTLGKEFASGGWWEFDDDGREIEGRRGNWDKTGGQIPMWVHYYQRDKITMSRAGTVELGNVAVAHMNLNSAADFDAWDAASSLVFILGADAKSFNTTVAQIEQGSRIVPVPPVDMGVGVAPLVPQIADSGMGAVASGVLQARLDNLRSVAAQLAATESSAALDSSGIARKLGFSELKSPRLALMASELETSQNIAITMLEQRFGTATPTTARGSVDWPRDYDLAPLIDQVAAIFDLQKTAGVMSPTLTSQSLVAVARDGGLIADDEEAETIEAEYMASAEKSATQSAQLDSFASMGI
jgi:hypothetical protein